MKSRATVLRLGVVLASLCFVSVSGAVPPPGSRNLLANPGFEQGRGAWLVRPHRAPEGKPMRGRTLAMPMPAAARTGEGGLVLSRSEEANAGIAVLCEALPVVPGKRYRLAAWVRAVEGERPGTLRPHVRFLGADRRPLEGKQAQSSGKRSRASIEWKERAFELVVPEGARWVTAGVALEEAGSAHVDDVSLTPVGGPSWRVVDGEVYAFHLPDGIDLPERARARADEAAIAAMGYLGQERGKRFSYFLYPDVETKTWLTGVGGESHHLVPDEVHTVRPVDRHAVVHLLMEPVAPEARVPPFLFEGLAVAFEAPWLDPAPERVARTLLGLQRLPVPGKLMRSETAFRAVDPRASHAVAGAFVRWLVRREGIGRLLSVYDLGTQEPGQLAADRFREVYGRELVDLEKEWRHSLR